MSQPRHTLVPIASGPPQERLEAGERREFLAFLLSGEQYALPLAGVHEILKPPPITQVPRAPSDVLGIISVRGRITTVVDLRRRLLVPESTPNKHTRVLLVDDGKEIIGCVVDRVLQVHRLSADEMELAAVVAGDLAEYVMGIGRPRDGRSRASEGGAAQSVRDESIIILLDPGPLLKR